jgi:UDP-N-acetylmuramoyl-tripeptide--D-alanyl-D-alanine ligase
VHLEFFNSVEEIALAKRELVEGLAAPGAVAVLNADDKRVGRFAEGFSGRVVTFGFSPRADFRGQNIEEHGVEGTECDFSGPEESARLRLPLAGRHNVMNALAALAAASVWGVGAREAVAVFPKLAPAAMRGELLRFAEGFTVVNDAYNSNPRALESNIDLLAATPAARRVLAAGEMLELGESAPQLHREAGAYAAGRRLDWIFGVRGHGAEIVEGAIAAGHPAAQAQFFDSSEEAGKFLAGFLSSGDVLLVKGSRGVKMERIIEEITARHSPVPRGEG